MSKSKSRNGNSCYDNDASANSVSGGVDADAEQIVSGGDIAGRDSAKTTTLNFGDVNLTINLSSPLPHELWRLLQSARQVLPTWAWDFLRQLSPGNSSTQFSAEERIGHEEFAEFLEGLVHTNSLVDGGQVPAGIPVSEDLAEEIQLKPDEMFVIEVSGRSMVGADIFPGDEWLVRCQPAANNGDIVVAYLKTRRGRTIKRFFHDIDANYIVLKAENPDFPNIRGHVDDVVIHGVLVKKLASRSRKIRSID